MLYAHHSTGGEQVGIKRHVVDHATIGARQPGRYPVDFQNEAAGIAGVQGQAGLNFAAGVTTLTLTSVH